MRAMNPQTRFGDPGPGLRDRPWRVLTYEQLGRMQTRPDPDCELTLRLTGSMSRYMWSFDGTRFSDAEPIELHLGENVRITLINDTMMHHPIHLHGQQFKILSRTLKIGDTIDSYATVKDGFITSGWKDTVLIMPGEEIEILKPFEDYKGLFLYHCHNLEHEDMGMMRNFYVV